MATTTAELELPEVNGGVLKDIGDLVFVHKGLLYVVDGKTSWVSRLSESGQALHPVWSYDGQWLAYIRLSQQNEDSGSLWLIKRDGTQAHQVQGLPRAIKKGALLATVQTRKTPGKTSTQR